MATSWWRRGARWLVVIPVLQLLLLASGAACRPVADGPDTAARTAVLSAGANGSAEHAGHHPMPVAPPDAAPESAPASGHDHAPAACTMAMACSLLGIVPSTPESDVPVGQTRTRIATATLRAPASERGAPEPPPPRA